MLPIPFTHPGIVLPLRSRLVANKQLGVWIKTMSARSSNPRHEQNVFWGSLFYVGPDYVGVTVFYAEQCAKTIKPEKCP